jgi:hypothetical protein
MAVADRPRQAAALGPATEVNRMSAGARVSMRDAVTGFYSEALRKFITISSHICKAYTKPRKSASGKPSGRRAKDRD